MKKCPICELNYMQETEEMCDVCKQERGILGKSHGQIILNYRRRIDIMDLRCFMCFKMNQCLIMNSVINLFGPHMGLKEPLHIIGKD